MLKLFRLDPITRKRLKKFRSIKRGYYSLVILVLATFISLFSELLANNKALIAHYNGSTYFPAFKELLDVATPDFLIKPQTHYMMKDFGQEDDWGLDDIEADYRKMAIDFKGTDNWVVMPIIPWNPIENDFGFEKNPPNAPNWQRSHFLGTDGQGRDVAARLLYGFRISILFSLLLVLSSQVFGTIIGCLQGYLGGRFDLMSQRVIEVWSTLPFLYVVIVLSLFFTPGFMALLFIMGIFQWIGITYYMRTELYREKTREYALAARSIGASHTRIIFKHLLPNCLTPLVTFTPFAIVGAIFALTALDYLGYGLPAPTPSWGEMIEQATESSNRDKMWLVLSPFAAISVTLILVTLVGESIREAFDPKQYARYQ